MAEIFKELTLDVFAANRIKAIVAKQYDYKSRHLLIRLTDGGNNIDVESSSTVTVNAFRPNGESAAFLGSAEQDGRVIVPLAYWMLELEGTVKCDVSIVDTEGRKLSTTNFQIEVERANYSGDDIEQDEHYDLLVELLAEVAQAQEAENARVAAETARQTTETARASAETARDTAEGARSSAETARGTAETARESAEATRQLNEASRVSAEAARAAAETAREEAEEAREQALLDYAKKDGFYEGLTAGLAENLTPYSEDSGITQTQPFFLEGTGNGNGESISDVGNYLQLKEKRGNMVCVNQLVQNNDITATYTNPVASDNYAVILGRTISMVANHTYLISAILDANCNNIRIRNVVTGYVGTSYTGSFVFTAPATSNAYTIQGYLNASSTSTRTLHIVDLTQWFNGNIPAYLLSNPKAFGRYYKGSLAYEPGRLEPATGRYLTSVGRNIWDEEWEVGSIGAGTGNNEAGSTTIRSKNYIEVSPNVDYYFYINDSGNIGGRLYDAQKNYIGTLTITSNSVFSVPANACYLRFVVLPWYGTTYKHDITISGYYTGESGYDKYYPHEVLATIDTGTESLYSAGSAYDSKVPSGLITHNIYSVDLATLNYSYSTGGNGFWYSTDLSDLIKNVAIASLANMISDKYTVVAGNTITGGTAGVNSMGLNGVNLYIYNGSSTESPTGTLYFELATPTIEQGTPFQENVPIDDFGQLSWSNTDVPQGNQIFYPVDYKAYEDTLIKYTDGDATSLVRKTDYATYDTPGVIKSRTPGFTDTGIIVTERGLLTIISASDTAVKLLPANAICYPLPLAKVHRGVFYGLSKAAGVDLASSTEETAPNGTNAGIYPASAIQAIMKMLLPATPTTDGAYDLVCTVTNGQPVYSWVART